MPNEPVSPSAVYHELLSLGASTAQAIGIMANIVNESGFNAGAVGDQGTSFGLVQQHGNYGYLVTGNPINDMKAQLKLVVQNGGLPSGSSAAAAAGNFAANYERCVGCQPGGDQYNSRVGNVSQLLADLASGKWPTSGGSGGGGGGGGGSGGGSGGGPAGGGGVDEAGIYNAWLTAGQGSQIQTASLLSGGISDIVDPFQAIQDAASALARIFSSPTISFLDVFKVFTNAFASLQRGIAAITHDIQWLFYPSHWVRIFAFLFGIVVLVPAMYALMHTGQGDMYLAMGIGLTTLAGVLLFIAFHSLPTDVTNLQQLLAWISASIRQGSPAGPVGGTPGVTTTAARQSTAGTGKFANVGAPSASGASFTPVPDATSIFPIIGQTFPTPTGNPPLSTQLTA